MNSLPDWLPDMFEVSPWTDHTFKQLYNIFRTDLVLRRLNYLGNNVWFYQERDDGKEVLFWHITHREDKNRSAMRMPDLRRSERLPWVRPMIMKCPNQDDDMLNWDYEEGNKVVKTYIWLINLDFVVIMKKYDDGRRRLITSFHLDNNHEERKMRKKYENRIL
jgi:hypothetical protein